ncbi:MAG: hypothetical protein WCO89_02205 [Syntrophus sp. (in: bacteria)]
MSFLKRFFGNKDEKTDQQAPTSFVNENQKVADSPELFADWINKYVILSQSFEDDLSLAPDEEQCNRLSISRKERTLCANENVLLRALGACLFVRNNLDEHYYLLFRELLMPLVIERMERHAPYRHCDNPSEALDQYLEELKSDSNVGFSMTYIDRVYPDTPNSESIFRQGIPVHLGLKHVMNSFEIVQDGFSRLKFGIPYEALEKLNNVLNESEEKRED